jgi:hypothetical protein
MAKAVLSITPTTNHQPIQRERATADVCRALTVLGQIVLLARYEVTRMTPVIEGSFTSYRALLGSRVEVFLRPAYSLVVLRVPSLPDQELRIGPNGDLPAMQITNLIAYLRRAGLYVPDPDITIVPEFALRQMHELSESHANVA